MELIHLLKAVLKLLAWIEGKLPDRPRLAAQLVLLGSVLVLPVVFPQPFDHLGDLGALLAFLMVVSGFLALIIGGYILFRHSIWRWQEKRARKFISLNLK